MNRWIAILIHSEIIEGRVIKIISIFVIIPHTSPHACNWEWGANSTNLTINFRYPICAAIKERAQQRYSHLLQYREKSIADIEWLVHLNNLSIDRVHPDDEWETTFPIVDF